jgi:lipopolysaccharide/colanic/teichoic acid biosynthesis glycosyltransferase
MARIQSILRQLFQFIGRRSAPNGLHSPERMSEILERERMRADRGHSSFSLVTFTYPTTCDANELEALSKLFYYRLRATDDAGMLRPQSLGAVLPETSAEGAWKVANDICQLLTAEMRRPECNIFTYPTAADLHDPPVNRQTRKSAQANGSRRNGALNGHSTNGHPVKKHSQPMHGFFARPLPAWKRAIDVAGASIALLLLGPMMLLAAALIKLTSPGPVLFSQWRDTIGGRPFRIYKFRTMVVDAESKKAALMSQNEQDGPAFKIVNDPRITRLGRFLRVTSIDELPQLFNVILGEMTLVGPRAMDSNESGRCESWQRRRLDVTAGITCIWQVRGRSSVSFAEWMRMDLRYVRSRSLVNDLKLMSQTVPAVLLRRGAC